MPRLQSKKRSFLCFEILLLCSCFLILASTQVPTWTPDPARQMAAVLDNGCNDRSVAMTILFDGSGSISSQDFDQQKMAGKALAAAVLANSKKNQVGAVVFSSDANSTDLTSDLPRLHRWIDTVEHQRASTRLDLALQLAFQQLLVSNATHKVAFVITDGYADNSRLAILQAQSLKNFGIEIICLAVGDFNATDPFWLQIASPSLFFSMSSMNQLVKYIGDAVALTNREPTIAFQAQYVNKPTFGKTDPLILEVVIRNLHRTNAIYAGTWVATKAAGELEGKEYEHFEKAEVQLTSDIPPRGQAVVRLEIPQRFPARPAGLPSSIQLHLVDWKGDLIHASCGRVDISTEIFMSEYANAMTAINLRLCTDYSRKSLRNGILIAGFGPIGTGKSTFGNLVSTLFHRHYYQVASAGTAPGMGSHTLEFVRLNLTFGVPIQYLDTIGWDSIMGYPTRVIEAYLDGLLPLVTNITTEEALDEYLSKHKPVATPDTKVSVVITPFPISFLTIPSQLEPYKRLLEVCRRKSIPAIVLVSGIQNETAEMRAEAIEAVHSMLGPQATVPFYHYGNNLGTNNQKNFKVDKNTLQILDAIVIKAIEKIENQVSNSPELFPLCQPNQPIQPPTPKPVEPSHVPAVDSQQPAKPAHSKPAVIGKGTRPVEVKPPTKPSVSDRNDTTPSIDPRHPLMTELRDLIVTVSLTVFCFLYVWKTCCPGSSTSAAPAPRKVGDREVQAPPRVDEDEQDGDKHHHNVSHKYGAGAGSRRRGREYREPYEEPWPRDRKPTAQPSHHDRFDESDHESGSHLDLQEHRSRNSPGSAKRASRKSATDDSYWSHERRSDPEDPYGRDRMRKPNSDISRLRQRGAGNPRAHQYLPEDEADEYNNDDYESQHYSSRSSKPLASGSRVSEPNVEVPMSQKSRPNDPDDLGSHSPAQGFQPSRLKPRISNAQDSDDAAGSHRRGEEFRPRKPKPNDASSAGPKADDSRARKPSKSRADESPGEDEEPTHEDRDAQVIPDLSVFAVPTSSSSPSPAAVAVVVPPPTTPTRARSGELSQSSQPSSPTSVPDRKSSADMDSTDS